MLVHAITRPMVVSSSCLLDACYDPQIRLAVQGFWHVIFAAQVVEMSKRLLILCLVGVLSDKTELQVLLLLFVLMSYMLLSVSPPPQKKQTKPPPNLHLGACCVDLLAVQFESHNH